MLHQLMLVSPVVTAIPAAPISLAFWLALISLVIGVTTIICCLTFDFGDTYEILMFPMTCECVYTAVSSV